MPNMGKQKFVKLNVGPVKFAVVKWLYQSTKLVSLISFFPTLLSYWFMEVKFKR